MIYCPQSRSISVWSVIHKFCAGHDVRQTVDPALSAPILLFLTVTKMPRRTTRRITETETGMINDGRFAVVVVVVGWRLTVTSIVTCGVTIGSRLMNRT